MRQITMTGHAILFCLVIFPSSAHASWITIQFIGGAPGMDVETSTDFGWTHAFDPTDKTIFSVELEISAYDVDYDLGERDEVFADGISLGYLTGSTGDDWTVTSFAIDSALLLDGQLDVWLDIDADDGGWMTTIDYSRLETHWDWQDNTVPVPSALLLTGVGFCSIRYLRRNITL